MQTSTTLWRGLLMLGVMAVFAGTSYAQRTVTLQLNTASIADTVKAGDLIEIRGAVGGVAPSTLPDGNTIDWSSSSTLEPANSSGDYWNLTFQIPNDQEMVFKFWSANADAQGLNTGWESDNAGGGNYSIPAGTGDVDLGLHFFNATGGQQAYDWRPFASKPDTVGVWYRVYMCTDVAQGKGYNPNDSGQSIGLRGDNMSGASQLDWGSTLVTLNRESATDGTTGYQLYSGVAYYPTSATGQTQAFKFFINGVPDGWENGDNRTFKVPQSDSTLHWTYFSNSSPTECGVQPVTSTVIFGVDTQPLETIGLFDRTRGDTLEVRGGFNGWNCDNPDDCLLDREPGTTQFFRDVVLTLIPNTDQEYKYFINFNDVNFETAFGEAPPSGWEEPITTQGANRRFTFEGNPSANQELPTARFNDIFDGNIIPDGTSVDVTFTVDMTPALSNAAQPFVPGTDSVFVQFGDPLWRFTQGTTNFNNDRSTQLKLLDPEGDNIYTGTLTVVGPTYDGLQYQYAYGPGIASGVLTEQGGSTSGSGRRRTRFISKNPDGSRPATWAFPAETFQAEGSLPFEGNPHTAVEEVGGELPTQISLGQNYPNPFNPNTVFEYNLDGRADVKVRVYDVTGRLVTTLFEGTQPAGTYRVTFSGEGLASGTYFYRLETPRQTFTRSMVLVK
jgi:hypothetical protein